VFESSGRLPVQERKLIVPNTHLKLTLTYRNGIAARVGTQAFLQREHTLTLTGLIDTPVILDAQEDTQTGTIIIEFNPLGAYRFFPLSFADVQNQIVPLTDLMGRRAGDLQAQLADVVTPEAKLQLLQNFLVTRLGSAPADLIYDYCIDRIVHTCGQISVALLEKETGYSARWLQRKFKEHLGTGPKNLAEIIRFKPFYHAFSTGAPPEVLRQHIYQYYHDQSHFLRAFKRFTGTTPTALQNSLNELSTRNFSS